MSIGNRIKDAREGKGWSQDDLSSRIGVHRKTISVWETDLKEPRGTNLVKLADALCVSPGWLRIGVGDPSPTVKEITGHMSVRDVLALSPIEEALEIHKGLDQDGLMLIPCVSPAWALVDEVLGSRKVQLSENEHSRLVLEVALASLKANREPTLDDVAAALGRLLAGI